MIMPYSTPDLLLFAPDLLSSLREYPSTDALCSAAGVVTDPQVSFGSLNAGVTESNLCKAANQKDCRKRKDVYCCPCGSGKYSLGNQLTLLSLIMIVSG